MPARVSIELDGRDWRCSSTQEFAARSCNPPVRYERPGNHRGLILSAAQCGNAYLNTEVISMSRSLSQRPRRLYRCPRESDRQPVWPLPPARTAAGSFCLTVVVTTCTVSTDVKIKLYQRIERVHCFLIILTVYTYIGVVGKE